MYHLSKVRVIFLGIVLFVGVSTTPTRGAEIKDIKFFEIEAGRITYTVSGFQTGIEIFTWKDYGLRSMRKVESQTEFMGVKQENRQITVMDGIWIYTLDPASNTATKMENPIIKGMVEKGDGDIRKAGEEMMRAMGGKVVGKETVLGKPCVLWLNEQMMNMKTCVWKGIALKTQGGMAGMEVNQTATDLKIGKVSDEEVSLPAGVKIVDQENPMEAIQKMQRGRPPGGGMKNFKGMPGGLPEGQDPAKMMEQLKKMQEEMQKRGMAPK